METNDKINQYLYMVGVVLLFLGAFDPLEGSMLIGAGSLLLTVTSFRKGDAQWKVFFAGLIMIAIGVSFLLYLASHGSFDGGSSFDWRRGLFILPYPIGWALTIIVLVARIYKKPSAAAQGK